MIVKFDMQPGARDALLAAGARDDPASKAIRGMGLDWLPVLEKGNRNQVHVKAELGWLNFGLRKGSVSVDVFNSRILRYDVL
ncbi:hypothetical protein [Streptoalloteichus tenebrarius]|uniref:hypothetical protein n=1 Tax=Streptoalloteichus tenebrarius (strain ATCC 17920 / DSM 40477 / JCM 4838 / CBS 697.72 / NBRC 16177 / NCIMB 11028 / NRRL B-12390 / A12253. 1 / ISP 5477) TaxID=1933 RepID=UPI0020A5205C|nr:hypothetical protein [Streptoalloteichus tenebrarius]BFF03466.1 hypothetical protein GCM10020241_51410 [Streptoalloteichus tenebrarius]